jgi:hypothetical protein
MTCLGTQALFSMLTRIVPPARNSKILAPELAYLIFNYHMHAHIAFPLPNCACFNIKLDVAYAKIIFKVNCELSNNFSYFRNHELASPWTQMLA